MDYSLCNSQGQNTGVGSLSLLQGIFQTQELNQYLLHCRQILYQLSHKGSLRMLEWVIYPFSSRSSQSRNRISVSCIACDFLTNWAIREAQERWKVTCKSMKLEHFLTPHTKINSKFPIELNTWQNTIKILEENIGNTFPEINYSNYFFRSACQSNRNRNNKQMGLNQTYKLLHSKGSHKQSKKTTPFIWIYTCWLLFQVFNHCSVSM